MCEFPSSSPPTLMEGPHAPKNKANFAVCGESRILFCYLYMDMQMNFIWNEAESFTPLFVVLYIPTFMSLNIYIWYIFLFVCVYMYTYLYVYVCMYIVGIWIYYTCMPTWWLLKRTLHTYICNLMVTHTHTQENCSTCILIHLRIYMNINSELFLFYITTLMPLKNASLSSSTTPCRSLGVTGARSTWLFWSHTHTPYTCVSIHISFFQQVPLQIFGKDPPK